MSTDDESVSPERAAEARARAAAAMRRLDREYRDRLIGEGTLVPARAAEVVDRLEAHVAALPALPIDAAGRRSAAHPVAVDRFGRIDLERANLAVLGAERLAS